MDIESPAAWPLVLCMLFGCSDVVPQSAVDEPAGAAQVAEKSSTEGAAGAPAQDATPPPAAMPPRRIVHVGDRLRLTFDAPIDAVRALPEDFVFQLAGQAVVIDAVEVKGNDPWVLELTLPGAGHLPLGQPLPSGTTLSFHAPGAIEVGAAVLPSFGPMAVEPGKHLFVLLGQSNMAGRGALSEAPMDALARVGLLAVDDGWEPASHPLNRHSTVRKGLSWQQVGPGYAFASVVQRALDADVGLVVNARGGPAIGAWLPGASEGLLEAAIERALLAERSGALRGVLWHHGESDRAQAGSYVQRLAVMVHALRAELHQPQLHFVAGQLGTWPDKDNDAINAAIAAIADVIDHASHVSGDGLQRLNPTSSHFSAEGQRVLGERYAADVLERVYGIE